MTMAIVPLINLNDIDGDKDIAASMVTGRVDLYLDENIPHVYWKLCLSERE